METRKNDIYYIYEIYGYQDRDEILVPTERQFWDVYEVCDLKVWEDVPHYLLSDRSSRKILKDAKKFLTNHLELHRIPYKGLLNELDWHLLLSGHRPEKIAKMCNATNIMINPFHLPVRFIGDDETEVAIVTNANLMDNPDFLSNIEVSYREIILDKNVTELTESSYIHELCHTQVTKVRGIVKNYLNSEVIPIFMELVNMYEAGKMVQWVGDFKRMQELMDHFSVLYSATLDGVTINGDLVNSSVYAISIMKAYELFIEYVKGNNGIKKYILNCIQNIFNGDLQLEEVLDEFEITTSSVLNGKKLLKYFDSRKGPF